MLPGQHERTMTSCAMDLRRPGRGLGLLLGCLGSVAFLRCEAQNLVPNPSFELKDTCPYTIGFQEGDRPLYWFPWDQSPEYFNACVPGTGVDSLVGVPLNGFGYQHAMEGDAYIGMYAYGHIGGGIDYREYAGCELLEPLEVGQSYDLSFLTSLAIGAANYWPMTWACNNMGMLFSMEMTPWDGWSGISVPTRNYAHLHSTAVITDTANWILVQGSFVADSAYRFLAIGNFFSNALTDTLHIVPGGSLGAYYYVDGVCVRKSGQPCEFTSGIHEQEAAVSLLWPNPASDQVQVRAGTGTSWQVFDATGRLLADGESTAELLLLPVGQWAPGEYVLRLQGEERRHVRFVVMR